MPPHRVTRAVVLFLLLSACAHAADNDGFEDTFNLKPESFRSSGRNDFFSLEPGHQLVLEGEEDGKPARLVITVLEDTRKVDGVETRVVEEHESIDAKTIEISRNFFAIDKNTSDVYYFGEEVDDYKNGKIVGHSGAWVSGKNGARYGLFMPAKPRVGRKAYQEIAPKVAMDRFEVISTTENVNVPAGEFANCLKTLETTPLEPNEKAHKLYAPGVGLLIDGPHKLVKHGKNIEPRRNQQKKDPGSSKKAATQKEEDANLPPPFIPHDLAREALNSVGADPDAEAVWVAAINDPGLTAHQRSDLIEDLNENGFADPRHVTLDELPLVLSRLDLIEQLAPDAMDEVNEAAFKEAHKDLTNIANRLSRQ